MQEVQDNFNLHFLNYLANAPITLSHQACRLYGILLLSHRVKRTM